MVQSIGTIELYVQKDDVILTKRLIESSAIWRKYLLELPQDFFS